MSTLNTTRAFRDGDPLVRSDLDAFLDDIEGFFNTVKINDDNIQTAGITASTKILDASITEAKIASEAITADLIANSAVTTAKIADSAITTAKILNENVTAAKLDTDAVTTAKIANATIATADILDAAVTNDKVAAGAFIPTTGSLTRAKRSTNYELLESGTTTGFYEATGKTFSLGSRTCYGRPCVLMLYSGTIRYDLGAYSGGATYSIKLQSTTDGVTWDDVHAFVQSGTTPEGSFSEVGDPQTITYGEDNREIIVHEPGAGTLQYRIKLDYGGYIAWIYEFRITAAIKLLWMEI